MRQEPFMDWVVETRKTNKLFDAKVKKHDKITVLAQTKLDSVHDTISKAINDGHIDSIEFSTYYPRKTTIFAIETTDSTEDEACNRSYK